MIQLYYNFFGLIYSGKKSRSTHFTQQQKSGNFDKTMHEAASLKLILTH